MTTPMRRRPLAFGAMLALVVPGVTLRAQGTGAGDAPPSRYTVEGFLARYALDDGLRTGTRSPGGFGLRVGFNRGDDRSGRTLADRATGGVFAVYTANQGNPSVGTLHVGVETDAFLVPRPILGGVIDPFLSLGLGIFRSSIENRGTVGAKRIVRSDLAFTPALGTRVPFFNGIGARGDLRMPIVFGFSTSVNFVAEGGLYVSF